MSLDVTDELPSTNAIRMGHALPHEDQVKIWMEEYKFTVCKFGQTELFPNELVDHFRQYRNARGEPTLLRWLPDFIAFNQMQTLLIDAKTSMSKTENWAVESNALRAAELLQVFCRFRFIIVTPDKTVITVPLADRFGWPIYSHEGSEELTRLSGMRGSGTPFLLIEKLNCFPLKRYLGG